MSDVAQGPDWWLASDGKWYPPSAPQVRSCPNGHPLIGEVPFCPLCGSATGFAGTAVPAAPAGPPVGGPPVPGAGYGPVPVGPPGYPGGPPMAPAPAAPANRGLIIGLVAGVVVVVAALVVGIVLVTHKTTTTATTASSGLPPSTSLSEFESDVKTQLGEAEPKGFAVAGVGSVVCNMPRVWQPGATFQCFAYSSTSPEGLGVVDVTVETTQPGDVYDDNLSWRPAAAAGNTGSGNSGSGSSGNSGSGTSGSGSSGTGTSGSGNSGNSGSGNSGSSRTQ